MKMGTRWEDRAAPPAAANCATFDAFIEAQTHIPQNGPDTQGSSALANNCSLLCAYLHSLLCGLLNLCLKLMATSCSCNARDFLLCKR